MKTRGFDCVDRQYANRYKRILTTPNHVINWGKSVIRPSAPPCRSSASYSIDFHLSPFSLCRQPALFIPPAALLTFVCSFYLCLISPSLWNLSIGQLATIPSWCSLQWLVWRLSNVEAVDGRQTRGVVEKVSLLVCSSSSCGQLRATYKPCPLE